MSYTPTTEEVRDDYAHFQVPGGTAPVTGEFAEGRAEFDRWLAAHDAEADLRDVAHISCDCVPDLGPEHCHLCSDREGHEVTWTECSSHLLDPERARTWLQREFGSALAHDPHNPERFWGDSARALCQAAKRGELSA